jgi:uncharacterized RDD family membrane protein YckC
MAYATFTARVSALAIDFIVVSACLVFIVLGGSALQGVPGSGPVEVALVWALVILYEPLLVWRRGATIGHRRRGLQVVTASGDRPPLLRSFGRFAIKGVLGMISFIPMFFTRRHQALQDLVTGTRVIVHTPHAVPWYYVTTERATDWMNGAPPVGRRVVIIILYLFATFAAALAMLGSVSHQCVAADQCGLAEAVALRVGTWGWLAGSCAIAVAGWRGMLPGARRRPPGIEIRAPAT